MPLLIAFLLVPLVEIGLFIQIGGFIGLWPTLAIVVVTAIVGAKLVQHQGSGVLARLQSSFQDLRDPSEPLAEGAMILFSGALLLTPGFFTDAVGFALLVPGVRRAIIARVRSRMAFVDMNARQTGEAPFEQGTHSSAKSTIVEGDYDVVDPEDEPKSPGNSGWTRH